MAVQAKTVPYDLNNEGVKLWFTVTSRNFHQNIKNSYCHLQIYKEMSIIVKLTFILHTVIENISNTEN